MENREKIIQLLKNPLVTGYGIEKMSNGRLYSANFQRYKNWMIVNKVDTKRVDT
ncbi:hypothetical protein [Enterococcus sp. DIV0086]|uniref:hypothetical protein n=1 Tax=Enterococcus sp. DIV0086 TaxID=2774655 RepID=UPI003D27208F